MSHRQNLYVLTIPLTEGSLLGCRTLAQIILRRRALGPITIRDEGKGPLTTNVLSIQALFADQLVLDTVKSELRRYLPHVSIHVRQEQRKNYGGGDPPCSCVLLGVQGERPCYYHQETCLRHGKPSGDSPQEEDPRTGEAPELLRETSHPGWAVVSQRPGRLAPSQTVTPTWNSSRLAPASGSGEKRYQAAQRS